jgi:hypothetical protein
VEVGESDVDEAVEAVDSVDTSKTDYLDSAVDAAERAVITDEAKPADAP